MDNFIVAFFALLGSIFLARIISNRAMQQLDPEKKILLVDLFTKDSLYNIIVLILIVALFFLSLQFQWLDKNLAFLLYIFLLLSYTTYNNYSAFRKLKKNDFPEFYIRAHILSAVVRTIGLVAFFLMIDWR